MGGQSLDEALEKALAAPLFYVTGSPMYGRASYIGKPTASLLVCVLGCNASGKSLFRREIQSYCVSRTVKCLDLSMELRSQDPWIRAESYGDEEAMSTGLISLSAMMRLLSLSRETAEPHILFWDEPDVGLSDEVAAGAALDIAEYLAKPSPSLLGAFVVSHRRAFLEALSETKPRVLFFGLPKDRPVSLTAWLKRPVSPVRPAEVIREGVLRWSAVSDFLKKRKK